MGDDKRPYYCPWERNYTEEIQTALSQFGPLGFPVSTWTESTMCRDMCCRPTTWLKKVKIATSITDPDVLSGTLNIGLARGFWTDNASCTPRELYKFCDWLRTPDGVKARDDVYFLLRMQKKKRKRPLTATEEKREVGLHYEARIDALQIQIRKLEQERKEQTVDPGLNDKKSEFEARIEDLQTQILKLREEKIQKMQEEEDVDQGLSSAKRHQSGL